MQPDSKANIIGNDFFPVVRLIFREVRNTLVDKVSHTLLNFSSVLIKRSLKLPFLDINPRVFYLSLWREDIDNYPSGSKERLSFALARIPDALSISLLPSLSKDTKRKCCCDTDD